MSGAGLWPATRDGAALNMNAVIPRGRLCLLNPHRDPSGSGGFLKHPGMLGTTTGLWRRAWGPAAATSEQGLVGAQGSPALWGLSTPSAQRGSGDAHSPQDRSRGLRRVGTCPGPRSQLFWGWVGKFPVLNKTQVGSSDLFLSLKKCLLYDFQSRPFTYVTDTRGLPLCPPSPTTSHPR